MTTIAPRLGRKRLHSICVVAAAAFAASCSVTGEDSPRAGAPGFGSALASVLSEAKGQIAADGEGERAATSFAGAESGAQPPVTGASEAGLPAAVGFVPAENPATRTATAAPQTAAAPVEPARRPAAETPAPATAATTDPSEPPAAAGKRGFLASLFSSDPAAAAAAPRPVTGLDDKPKDDSPVEPTKPLVKLASTGKPGESRRVFSDDPLPGVRQSSLFEITRKSGLDDDSDIDLYEVEPSYQVASAAGLARLAPNGLLKQSSSVDVACLKPSLVRMLKTAEQHFGKKMIITSGYRSPERNRAVRGARNSMHMHCAAVDVVMPGIEKHRLAAYMRALPGRGGVGTYCHISAIHVDVGPERDWNWRCRARKG
ncbi:YcbK family protein [Aquibium microcysteis]|uniref:YcbK family protein n=1 Tax=Aquibium microcysteis TaxID=675281 RepID=UPI001EF27E35|nr:D-Ala-D-Ala carboxypeptidase family metallohydrolase [Aquibium microcysteis]